ncbi:MAG: class III cytochrome c, partial [Deltaproteobacteria bacterium]|nr:class III cytochrome c [Deltaproteobacteria bacterium]
MEKGRTLLRWTGILTAVAMAAIIMSSPAVFGIKTQPKVTPEIRADIISIDSMKVFGKLERPSVSYLHQRHTEA